MEAGRLFSGRRARLWMLWLAVLGLLIAFWQEALLGLRVLLGALVVAFFVEPLVSKLEARLSRPRATALSFLLIVMGLGCALWLLVPPLVAQFSELMDALPEIAAGCNAWIGRANAFLVSRGFAPLSLESVDWRGLLGGVGSLWSGTARVFGSIAGMLTQAGLSVLLAYYWLADKRAALLRAELAVPVAWRRTAARMAAAVKGEMLGYVRGQSVVSICVAALSATALSLIGVPGYLALGVLIGVTNLIPYFGPLIGGAPAVLCALARGPLAATLTLAALFAVQQIDGMLLTPRITGGATGLRPPAVLISVLLGGSAFGAAGMLLAVPVVLTVRAAARIWVSERGAHAG